MNTPRGIRNNNPGNIRLGIEWEGLVDQIGGVGDNDFCQFIDAAHGIRAINHILTSYANRGITTVQEIIDTWAPPVENDTGDYVSAVCASMACTPNTDVTPELRGALIAAIIEHENGEQPYTTALIDSAIVLA